MRLFVASWEATLAFTFTLFLTTGRFYRSDCTFKGGYYLKDLSIVDKDLSRIVLVDNNPVSFICNPSNGIPVPSFYEEADDEALGRVLRVLEFIKDSPDVRVPLDKMFEIQKALEPHVVQIMGADYMVKLKSEPRKTAVSVEGRG